ncbi:hypothetical protein SAMN05720606_109149 [Paenibacillus polysaccharolyticus]|uniref:Uncharacterized protein n=1 Tax=Paenibacillus polysaccharolyticus TaxID=582692 RepID=A0A1G5IT01_9BACL|nr:hypothetical protein [Paenibacillus polysaccharolyticus]SCY79196.1 hypothetical protein SAMN05720606_109149 [Paenibacillus polysaccharolyticus]
MIESTQGGTDTLNYKPMKLGRDQVINHWLINGIYTEPVAFVPTTMEGDINDWLIDGFAIHENPCRQEFVEHRRSQPVSRFFDQWSEFPSPGDRFRGEQGEKPWEIYSPWGNPRVEKSGFWFVPTHLRSYAATRLVSPTAHKASFRIKTYGSLTLWINGEQVTDFAPLIRNKEQEIVIQADLVAGINEIYACWEDLAERDTMYAFALEYLGKEELQVSLPIASHLVEPVRSAERALEQAYFPSDIFKGEQIKLKLPLSLPDIVREMRVEYGNFFDGTENKTIQIAEKEADLVLGHTNEIGHHYVYFTLTLSVSNVVLTKKFGCQSYDTRYDEAAQQAKDIEARKSLALKCIAEKGSSNIHTAIAMLKTNGNVQAAENMLLEGVEGIEERKDCSDFYLVGLFRLWRDERDSGLFSEAFWERVKASIVNYRYWIDEPGDDVMWFFSENHALLFHTNELLAGQLFGEEMFTNSGETGEVHRQKAEQRLALWFERFMEEGLAEWNSSAYIPIDAVGLLHIYEFAQNEQLREQAKKAMDLLFYYITIQMHQGVMSTTFGRSYEKELLGSYAAGTTSMCWIGYGVGHVNNYSISNVALSLSNYIPPAAYQEHLLLEENEQLTFTNQQGKGGYARLYHYRTAEYALSSIINFRPGKPGYQEHVNHLSLSPEAQVWVNHPAEIYKHGDGRPCFWAGNGILPDVVQHEAIALMMFDIPATHTSDWTHAYFPTSFFTTWEKHEHWYFGCLNKGYVALYAANGTRMEKNGVTRERELVSPGLRNAWIIRAGNESQFGSFSQFIDQVRSSSPRFDSTSLTLSLTDPIYGSVQWGMNKPLFVQGEEIVHEGYGVRGKLQLQDIKR